MYVMYIGAKKKVYSQNIKKKIIIIMVSDRQYNH